MTGITPPAEAPTTTGKRVVRSSPTGGSGGSVYGLGLIGALVYYWQHAAGGVGGHLRAVGKAILWPAFVVHDLLKHLSG